MVTAQQTLVLVDARAHGAPRPCPTSCASAVRALRRKRSRGMNASAHARRSKHRGRRRRCRRDPARDASPRLAEEPGVSWAGVALVEDGALQLGPSAGASDSTRRAARADSSSRARRVGELWVDGAIDRTTLEQVATLIAPFALIGWDTGGEVWDPVAAGWLPRSRERHSFERGTSFEGLHPPFGVTTRRLGRGEGSRALVLRDGRADTTPAPTGRAPPLSPSVRGSRT